MNKAKELYEDGLKRMDTFKVESMMPALKDCNDGAINDVLNTNGCAYYQWTTCIVDLLKPKQVIELGGAMGVWTLCVLHYLPEDSKIYSITLEEGGLEFSFIKDTYSNLNMIIGNDLDLQNWRNVPMKMTDLWFFDALHTRDHLTKELNLYAQNIKEGAVALFDDIEMPELAPVWEDLEDGRWGDFDTYNATDPLHYSGYGIAIKL